MIEPFEKALKDIYTPSIATGVRDVKIMAADPNGIYLNKNQKTFPFAIIAKAPEPLDMSRKYTDTDETGATIMCIPFIARYELHVYLKNQRTAVDMLQHIALQSRRNPYVRFNYRGVPDFHIGLWTINLTQQQVSTEYSDTGGLVDVVWQFQANLVLTSLIKVPLIQTVKVRTAGVSLIGDETHSYDVTINELGKVIVTPE